MSESCRVIYKSPRHLELAGKLRRECLHPKRLRRVMPSVKHVDAQFLRRRVSPVRPFARHECVHAYLRRQLELTPRAARDDADATAISRSARQQDGLAPDRLVQTTHQILPRNARRRLEPEELALREIERL